MNDLKPEQAATLCQSTYSVNFRASKNTVVALMFLQSLDLRHPFTLSPLSSPQKCYSSSGNRFFLFRGAIIPKLLKISIFSGNRFFRGAIFFFFFRGAIFMELSLFGHPSCSSRSRPEEGGSWIPRLPGIHRHRPIDRLGKEGMDELLVEG